MATAHALAVALDEYLALTHGPTLVPLVAVMRTPAEALAITDEDFAFYHLRDGNVPPAVRALSRLRLEAACEVERLLRLLDALDAMDGDPDLEPCCEDEGAQCEDEGALADDEPTLGASLSFAAGGTEWDACCGRISDALNRVRSALTYDAGTMPRATCAALDLPEGATYAQGAQAAEVQATRLSRRFADAMDRQAGRFGAVAGRAS